MSLITHSRPAVESSAGKSEEVALLETQLEDVRTKTKYVDQQLQDAESRAIALRAKNESMISEIQRSNYALTISEYRLRFRLMNELQSILERDDVDVMQKLEMIKDVAHTMEPEVDGLLPALDFNAWVDDIIESKTLKNETVRQKQPTGPAQLCSPSISASRHRELIYELQLRDKRITELERELDNIESGAEGLMIQSEQLPGGIGNVRTHSP
ncbi:hypothetical protein HDU85_004894 [Gaertneriomyces sp. JEL0708]|nr:hypothetical protein HDU85_004894 [Gaertneriomyces sp. JEL0708]